MYCQCISIRAVIIDGSSLIQIYRHFNAKTANRLKIILVQNNGRLFWPRYIPTRQTENTRNVKSRQMFGKKSLKHEFNLSQICFVISYTCRTLLIWMSTARYVTIFFFNFFFFLIWKSKDLCKIGTMEANSNKYNEFIQLVQWIPLDSTHAFMARGRDTKQQKVLNSKTCNVSKTN